MKKIFIVIVLVACGWLLFQYKSAILTGLFATITNAPIGDESSTGIEENLGAGDANDLLESLAQKNSAFRWSLDIENQNSDGDLYQLQTERDFRSRYNLDSVNQNKQNWSSEGGRWQYKEWVGGFYSGESVVGAGWTAGARKMLGENPSPESIRYINVIGRLVASEWCKSVRKIDNMDLLAWNSLQKVEKLPELALAVFNVLKEQ